MKKKLLSLVLVAAMALAAVACGSKEEAAAPAATEEKEVLVMATNAEFPPYEYYEGQDIVGIDAEIAAVTSGKADFGLAAMTVTEDRLESVNFSDTYATATQVVIVTEDSAIASVADLEGKKVGVQLGTTGDIYAEDIADATIERYNKGFEAVQALTQGKIDAVIIDNEPAKVFVAENEGTKILEEDFAVEEYAAAIAKENTELLEKVNTALAELTEDGTLQAIVDKYISAE